MMSIIPRKLLGYIFILFLTQCDNARMNPTLESALRILSIVSLWYMEYLILMHSRNDVNIFSWLISFLFGFF